MDDLDIDAAILDIALAVSNDYSKGLLRNGQLWWTLAESRWPEWVEPIRGGFADPFYADERIPCFIRELKHMLKHYQEGTQS